ncbi:MAG TPA: hypothetical protein VMR19_04965 [Candidatus Saccharimonadales bacterium]|nr:hypothetical protein [Candidatus Saccharimonadales bacterium]
MSANKVNKAARQLFIYVALIFVLLLAAINIETYQTPVKPVKILGTETQTNNDQKFWQDFLSKNPNYIPGLIETGRPDKVKEIDPNYITP